jgi:uncharacterized Fe-S cluster-containing radical SAM superfamily enzyme
MPSQDLDQLQREVIALLAATSTAVANLNTIATTASYANDAAAAVGGVAVGQIYRNGNILQVRIV